MLITRLLFGTLDYWDLSYIIKIFVVVVTLLSPKVVLVLPSFMYFHWDG